MMTYRERMLATINGQPTDCLPFVPRLDLWYKSNKYRGTLPSKYRNATLKQIVEDLDIGYHTAIPDFDLYNDSVDIIDRPLGIWRVHHMPWRASLRNVKRNVSYEDDLTIVEYITPYGRIRTKALYNETMRQSGITLSHVSEKAIKSYEDYKAIGYIFENIEVYPNYERLQEFKEYVGDLGIICAPANQGASPMHEIFHELMAFDRFFLEMYDHPDELKRLADQMRPYYDKVIETAANSPADCIMVGANYDLQLTWPDFMAEHVTPYLAAASEKMHAAGKYLFTHTDGENKKLLPFFVDGKIDIADSICPYPLTSLTIKDVRDAFEGNGITIWGGIPSVAVLENSMSDYKFESFINETFAQIGTGDRLILSIADTAPPDMKFSRLEQIAKKAKEFGPIKP